MAPEVTPPSAPCVAVMTRLPPLTVTAPGSSYSMPQPGPEVEVPRLALVQLAGSGAPPESNSSDQTRTQPPSSVTAPSHASAWPTSPACAESLAPASLAPPSEGVVESSAAESTWATSLAPASEGAAPPLLALLQLHEAAATRAAVTKPATTAGARKASMTQAYHSPGALPRAVRSSGTGDVRAAVGGEEEDPEPLREH